MIISYENCQYDLASQSSYNTAQTHALCYKQTFSLFAKSHLSVLARTCVSVRSLAGSRDEPISFLNTNQRSLLQITKSIRSLMQIMTIQCARTSSMRIGCSTSARGDNAGTCAGWRSPAGELATMASFSVGPPFDPWRPMTSIAWAWVSLD